MWALLVLGVINFIGLIATNRKIDEGRRQWQRQ
jgi:hypothetical protein